MADTELELLGAIAAGTIDAADVLYLVDVSAGTAHKLDMTTLATYLRTVIGEQSRVCTTTQANSTVTPAAITELSGVTLAPGRYRVKGWIVWRSAATTTGISLYARTTGGTTTRNTGHWYQLTTGGAATTGIADQDTAGTATGQMIEGRGWRTNGTDPGPTVGVDTANADQVAILEAVIVVTATATMDLMFRSEVAASAVTIQEGSLLEYERVG